MVFRRVKTGKRLGTRPGKVGAETGSVEVSVAGEVESILVVNTHLLVGKQLDRILVSRSLVEDESGRPDRCLRSVAVRPDRSIRGDADEPDEHWNHYWEIDTANRDLSNHYPLVAEFEIR